MDEKNALTAASTPKPATQKLLVCVGPGSSSAKLIRSTQKMADGLHAKWFAVYGDVPGMLMASEEERNRAVDNLRLAEQLGADTFILTGRSIAREIMDFSRQRNITRIITGKPRRSFWRGIFLRDPVAQLLQMSGGIDVYSIAGESGEQKEADYVIRPEKIHVSDYGAGLAFFALATALCFLMYPYFDQSSLIMVFLLGVTLTATSCGRGPAVLVSFLSVLAFDFFFVSPRLSFAVEEARSIVTFMVMLLVALIIGHLASRLRQQAEVARLQERQATAMHGLSRQLAGTRGVENILPAAAQYMAEIFDCRVVALLPDGEGKLHGASGDFPSVFEKDVIKEMNVARSAYDTGKMAGWGAEPSPSTKNIYVPLQAAGSPLGVIALRPREPERFLLHGQVDLLESLARQVALALEAECPTGNRTAS
jgi:two-component system, OmpR family, sensor histidine kinase KdpD